MSGYAFVSFSGLDKSKVEEISNNAPSMSFRSYQYDFEDGKSLLDEMKKHVKDCAVFIFMCSRQSLESVWCKFELNMAELELIKRGIKVRVIPLEEKLKIRDLPEWMQDYWNTIGTARVSVLERRFLDIIDSDVNSRTYFGLETRVESARRVFLNHITTKGKSPNIMFVTGADGIGRFTTGRGVIKSQLQNQKYSLGPVIYLGDPASLESLYIRLQEDFFPNLQNNYAEELEAFRGLSVEERVKKTSLAIEAFSKDDETIYLRCRSGLFGDDGTLVSWARDLLRICGQRSRVRIVIISNRQPRLKDLTDNNSIVHIHVQDLPDADISALIQVITLSLSGEATQPSAQALIAVGGHPVLAQSYAAALTRYGPAAENQAWYDTAFTQRHMLLEFLGYDSLESDERRILSILSWFPKISTTVITQVCFQLGIPDYQQVLDYLISMSLINYYGGNYAISGPVRLVFRQMYGIGDDNIIDAVRDIIQDLLPSEGVYKADTVDTLTFLFNISGTNLPPALERVASASSMLEAARELYREGREKPGNVEYNRCVSLCDAALQATDENALITEIQVVQARTYMRLKRFDLADSVVKVLEKNPDRQSRVIRAQYYRFKGEFQNAAPIYSEVIESGTNDDAVIHEYCICLREIGAFERVQDILERFSRRVVKNLYLLDMRSSLEIGTEKFRQAEETLEIMRGLPDRNQAVARKEAILVCKSTQNYGKALGIISRAISLVENDRRAMGDLHATRCVILCKMGLVDRARNDLSVVRSTHRQAEFVSSRLSIHLLMAEKSNEEALSSYESLLVKTRLDRALKKEILKRFCDDDNLLESTRIFYRSKYREILADRNNFTEFDF